MKLSILIVRRQHPHIFSEACKRELQEDR